jgi:superfamily II DNA or RNA helicase
MIHIHQGPYEENYEVSGVNTKTVRESKIVLRDYQQKAKAAAFDALRTHNSCLLELATGLGKTALSAKIMEEWDGRVMFLVHLEELLQNGKEEIEAMTGEEVGIERANEHWEGQRICVASVHSISHKLSRFSKDDFSLIICDEFHFAASKQHRRVFEYFNAKLIGVTATAKRADNKPLPADVCAFRMGIEEGIEQGYLVPIKGKKILVDEIHLDRVALKSNGNYDDEELDMEMVKGAAAIADIINEDFPFEKGILFFPGCASARLVNDLLNKTQPGNSVYVDGKITGNDRRVLIGKLRDGSANWFCNVGIATCGFNWPDASIIGICCPTKSRAGYIQRAGRGTRPLQGLLNNLHTPEERRDAITASDKPDMTILDFVGNSSTVDLISHETMLCTDELVEVEDDHPSEDSEPVDGEMPSPQVVSYNGIAREISSKTTHVSEEFSPFSTSDGPEDGSPVSLKGEKPEKSDTISDKQYKVLARYGIEDWRIPKDKAQKMMGIIFSKKFRLTQSDRKDLRDIYESK